jgi:hypothetical protein
MLNNSYVMFWALGERIGVSLCVKLNPDSLVDTDLRVETDFLTAAVAQGFACSALPGSVHHEFATSTSGRH